MVRKGKAPGALGGAGASETEAETEADRRRNRTVPLNQF